MKISIALKKDHKHISAPLQKEMVDFASFQFKVLMKKNLGLPVKSFQL